MKLILAKYFLLAVIVTFAILIGVFLQELGIPRQIGLIRDIPEKIRPFVDSTDLIRLSEVHLIRLDLDEVNDLSTSTRDVIAASIYETSKEYAIPPALLHAIFQIESEYRFSIDHPTVNVKVNGKLTRTHARGLGGIIWDLWSDKLMSNGIAETSSDLYLPKVNIRATGYILRQIINEEVAKNSDKWIVRRIITRYYGAQSVDYETKMKEATSSLWLKRIAREITEVQPDSTKR